MKKLSWLRVPTILENFLTFAFTSISFKVLPGVETQLKTLLISNNGGGNPIKIAVLYSQVALTD